MQDKAERFNELVKQHLNWYPLMEARDIYKLLYQGVMGSEHLIASADEFTQYLRREFDPLPANPSERILEPVRPDQNLLRLNLRAYKCHQLHVDVLIPALLETAQAFSGDLVDLRAVWKGFVQSCGQGLIASIQLDQLHQFMRWLDENGFPTAHHSEAYARTYQPAYRLISNDFIDQIGLGDAI
jgi:hypothetical protein